MGSTDNSGDIIALLEIIVGDLMRDYNMSLDQVLNLGYFEAHRLWSIADEIKARDLQYLSILTDYQNGNENTRKEFLDWIRSKQPRRFKRSSNEIPAEVVKMLEEILNG